MNTDTIYNSYLKYIWDKENLMTGYWFICQDVNYFSLFFFIYPVYVNFPNKSTTSYDMLDLKVN